MSKKSPPPFIYGTAWKKDATKDLVDQALAAGFRGIDTANQLKHYSEALVGEALGGYFKAGGKRGDLFLQTKFTSLDGQDARLPYDAAASIPEQVAQSFASSLEHLGVERIDSYLLHGPYNFPDIGEEDVAAWGAIEALYESKKAGMIGVSNVNALQLVHLVERAKIAPMTVQNRCYASRGWDRQVREICKAKGIVYEGFSLLTANPHVLVDPRVGALRAKYKATAAQIVFRFCRQIGILPLTGTSSPAHMKEDLACDSFTLEPSELEQLERISA